MEFTPPAVLIFLMTIFHSYLRGPESPTAAGTRKQSAINHILTQGNYTRIQDKILDYHSVGSPKMRNTQGCSTRKEAVSLGRGRAAGKCRGTAPLDPPPQPPRPSRAPPRRRTCGTRTCRGTRSRTPRGWGRRGWKGTRPRSPRRPGLPTLVDRKGRWVRTPETPFGGCN